MGGEEGVVVDSGDVEEVEIGGHKEMISKYTCPEFWCCPGDHFFVGHHIQKIFVLKEWKIEKICPDSSLGTVLLVGT